MFNFNANHLFPISRLEYLRGRSWLMLGYETRRLYGLFDFTKGLRLSPG